MTRATAKPPWCARFPQAPAPQRHLTRWWHAQLGVLSRVVREKGVLSVFDGLSPELVRGMLSGAVMLMVKEYIDAIVMGRVFGVA